MASDASPKTIGESSRRGRGRPRKVPPPPYDDPPPWYPRVTRSLTPAKIRAAEAAYFSEFLRRWARGDFPWEAQSPEMVDHVQEGTEGNPILIEDDDSDREDVDLGGMRDRPFLGMRPGEFYQMVPMEEDMDISEDENTPAPLKATEGTDEIPVESYPPIWAPGLYKMVPIPREELANYGLKDIISKPPLKAAPPPVQDYGLPTDGSEAAVGVKEEKNPTLNSFKKNPTDCQL